MKKRGLNHTDLPPGSKSRQRGTSQRMEGLDVPVPKTTFLPTTKEGK